MVGQVLGNSVRDIGCRYVFLLLRDVDSVLANVPMGVGFGISSKSDLDALRGSADLAIVGTAALKVWESSGATGLKTFFKELMA